MGVRSLTAAMRASLSLAGLGISACAWTAATRGRQAGRIILTMLLVPGGIARLVNEADNVVNPMVLVRAVVLLVLWWRQNRHQQDDKESGDGNYGGRFRRGDRGDQARDASNGSGRPRLPPGQSLVTGTTGGECGTHRDLMYRAL